MHLEHQQTLFSRPYLFELELEAEKQKNWLVDRPQELNTLNDNLIIGYSENRGW